MTKPVSHELFTRTIFQLFEETFEKHHGIYLDKGTSLFETLDTITSDEASRPVSAHCASLAAQVTHVIFYMEVLEKVMLHQEPHGVDWDEIWNRVEAVTADEWDALKEQLTQTYQRIYKLASSFDNWDDDHMGLLAIIVHTAYHLGEIRQALCTLK